MTQPLINITRKQALVFSAFLVLYEFLTYISNDMIMPGMIKVVAAFHGSESQIATSLTLYILGGASLQLFLGPLSDRFGRRPVMIFGAFFFFIFTIFIACSNSMQQFLSARFFQGMGMCFIGVVGYATLQEIFSEGEAVRLIAIMANISILAPLLGPIMGALFIHYLSWRLIFVVIGLFALIALWGLWRHMPESVGQVKRDGEFIPRVSLSLPVVAVNYKDLLYNRAFLFGSIAQGLLGLPCVLWIALAPVILIKDAHLSVIQYGLWQIPIFGAAIAGNVLLQYSTYNTALTRILWKSSILVWTSLWIMFFLPLTINDYFVWLMPGLILYFFGLGVANAPLARLTLFSTPVPKGTASAFMTLTGMLIQAAGIELGNIFYNSHNNLLFGLYCAAIGIVYFVCLVLAFYRKTP